eukprot:6311753-Pyramimonas_sp.AAC.1
MCIRDSLKNIPQWSHISLARSPGPDPGLPPASTICRDKICLPEERRERGIHFKLAICAAALASPELAPLASRGSRCLSLASRHARKTTPL